ncbi:hypothetical protein ACHAWO_009589 [Cyclotella atomus]|uniref:Uncharacterized protein n=1 Tax=Cyclotella atomus TaxID=382360 RepID=A0ABD3MP76_9STRA
MNTFRSLLSRRKFLARKSSSIAVMVILNDDETTEIVESSTDGTSSCSIATGDFEGFCVGLRVGEGVGSSVSITAKLSTDEFGEAVGKCVMEIGELEGDPDGCNVSVASSLGVTVGLLVGISIIFCSNTCASSSSPPVKVKSNRSSGLYPSYSLDAYITPSAESVVNLRQFLRPSQHQSPEPIHQNEYL